VWNNNWNFLEIKFRKKKKMKLRINQRVTGGSSPELHKTGPNSSPIELESECICSKNQTRFLFFLCGTEIRVLVKFV
jgi:hypothetical protein